MMNPTAETLFKLLRFALGGETDFTLPEAVDWKELVDLSFEQGVAAIAMDGSLKMIEAGVSSPELDKLDTPEMEDVKYDWFGMQVSQELAYAEHKKVLASLKSLLGEGGFEFLLLKGMSLGAYYPDPTHRHVGDIDIFVLPPHSAGEVDTYLKESRGLRIKRSKSTHHSTFDYHSTLVENHYELGNLYHGGKKALHLETEMRQLAFERSSSFNAVFLVRHHSSHFCMEKIDLRQLCDWWMYLKAEHSRVDWPRVRKIWRETDLERFAMAMSAACVVYFGMDPSWIPGLSDEIGELKPDAERLMEDILFGKKRNGSGFHNITGYFRNAWKFRMLGRSWLLALLSSAWMHLFHRSDMEEELV